MSETAILWKIVGVLLIVIGCMVLAITIVLRKRRENDVLSTFEGVQDSETERHLLLLVIEETRLLTAGKTNAHASQRLEKALFAVCRQEYTSIAGQYPELTSHDVAALMLTGLGMSNEMVAQLMGSSIRSFYNHRQRMAKRMKIETSSIDSVAATLMCQQKVLSKQLHELLSRYVNNII